MSKLNGSSKHSKRKRLTETFPDEEFLCADGFDDAILGIDYVSRRVIYDASIMVEILCEDMSREQAIEYLEFNAFGAYVGEQTPIYLITPDGL